MFLYEKFKEAEQIVLDRVNLKDYFHEHIDSTADLSAVHVNCPVHDDSTASMRYFEETDTFSCYGCGKGGNVIVLHRYVLKREAGEPDDNGDISYSRALLDLARLYRIDIPSFYSKDNLSADIIKIKQIKSVELKGLTYATVRTLLDERIAKLKKSDFSKFMELVSRLDTYEQLPMTSEEKTVIYKALLELN